jgi:aspartyl-tRNA(Asn)/glutamyl-tRNA(Gln) amidotransferase subunit C
MRRTSSAVQRTRRPFIQSRPWRARRTEGIGQMVVDEATVRRIARLARIKVTDAEAKALETELSGILDWVKQLDEVDTSRAEPMTRETPMTLRQRADGVTDGGMADAIVENAPVSDEHFFLVPKVVE